MTFKNSPPFEAAREQLIIWKFNKGKAAFIFPIWTVPQTK